MVVKKVIVTLYASLAVCALLVLCAWAVAVAVAEKSATVHDIEKWNACMDLYDEYCAGNKTNGVLKALDAMILSRTHGTRAAEVMAALEYEQGNLEAASRDAQIALRANPSDEKANRNFTRTIDRLPEARETKHIEEVLKSAQGQDPGAMLHRATYDARDLMTAYPALATNTPAQTVALADAYAARARKLADVWIPVREVIAQSVTNEEQAATILTQIENARAKTKAAVVGLEDMDEAAYGALADTEHDLTRFLKLTILPPAAMEEDAKAQTNAVKGVAPFNGRDWQADALDYTRAFRAKFPAWARAYEQQAQSDTNMPPFTAEDQAKVSALATELEKLQLDNAGTNALEVIRKIRELLPKNKNGGGGQNQQQQQQQNQNQQQQNQNQDQQSDQDQQQNENQPNEPQPDEQKQDDQKSGEDEPTPEDRECESILKRAQERSDEHEAEKRARMRKAPLPPNARDW